MEQPQLGAVAHPVPVKEADGIGGIPDWPNAGEAAAAEPLGVGHTGRLESYPSLQKIHSKQKNRQKASKAQSIRLVQGVSVGHFCPVWFRPKRKNGKGGQAAKDKYSLRSCTNSRRAHLDGKFSASLCQKTLKYI